jgi:L-alanine-DL-glutamate epimerase-like enolase superfamily enzyme
VELSLQPISARLGVSFVAGHGSVAQRDLLLVTLRDADGRLGYGEAAPLPSYDGVSISDVRTALEDCRAVLAQADGAALQDTLARCAEVAVLPQALAAIDLALWDFNARRAGRPVWRLLGAEGAPPITVNATIAAEDRAGAAREATAARAAGFGTVKLKVAIGDDAGRLAVVRACAGTQMAIRIDANGAWSPAEAQAALRLLAPVGLELCEEPVAGVPAIRELQALTEVPLALDESAGDPDALRSRAGQLVCLKIGRCGGISGTIEAARRARAAGYEVYLASTLDGPLGIAGALHAATVIEPARACGLATLGLFAERPDPLAPHAGTIAVPDGAGLGDRLLDWYLW